jgi:hypothetical protein
VRFDMLKRFLVVALIMLVSVEASAADGEFFRCAAHLKILYKNDKLVRRDVSRDVRAATKATAESAVRVELSKLTDAESSRTVSAIACTPIADTPNVSPWQCKVTAMVNGKKKEWQYEVNKEMQKYRSDAERYASRQFIRDFDGQGGAVDRPSIVAYCDDGRAPNQPTGKATPPALPSGAWTCKIAMHWAAIAVNGDVRRGWYGGTIENVSGQTEGNAIGLAYAAGQNQWAGTDGAGMRRVVWSQNTGRCWTIRKPEEPLGWPKRFSW